MNLQQLDWKNFTTETNVFTFGIPRVPENIAVIEVTTTEQKSTGLKTTETKIKKVLTGKFPEVLKECYPVFVKPSFFKFIKTKSLFYSPDNYVPKDHTFVDINIQTDQLSFDNLIWFYGRILFNSDGTPISSTLYYNYIGAPFTNRYCRLKDLLNYLKSHPWVVNKEDLEIENIPSYNAKRGEDRCISDVAIHPDQETYEKIFKLYQNSECRITDAICSQLYCMDPKNHYDWLGIAPFLKNTPG